MNKLAKNIFFRFISTDIPIYITPREGNNEYIKLFGSNSVLKLSIQLLNEHDWIHAEKIKVCNLYLDVLLDGSYRCVKYSFSYTVDYYKFDTNSLYISDYVDYDTEFISCQKMSVVFNNGIKFKYIEPVIKYIFDESDEWIKIHEKRMYNTMLDLNIMTQIHHHKLINRLKFINLFLECGLDIE